LREEKVSCDTFIRVGFKVLVMEEDSLGVKKLNKKEEPAYWTIPEEREKKR
jgi:hypothetical protein